MSARDDGGHAFPVPQYCGMTLRDYFAAKAMAAIINGAMSKGGADKPEHAAAISKAAYFMADAMLAERAK